MRNVKLPLAHRDNLVNPEQDFQDFQDFQDEGSDALALFWQATGYSMHQKPKIVIIVIIVEILLISCKSCKSCSNSGFQTVILTDFRRDCNICLQRAEIYVILKSY